MNRQEHGLSRPVSQVRQVAIAPCELLVAVRAKVAEGAVEADRIDVRLREPARRDSLDAISFSGAGHFRIVLDRVEDPVDRSVDRFGGGPKPGELIDGEGGIRGYLVEIIDRF